MKAADISTNVFLLFKKKKVFTLLETPAVKCFHLETLERRNGISVRPISLPDSMAESTNEICNMSVTNIFFPLMYNLCMTSQVQFSVQCN